MRYLLAVLLCATLTVFGIGRRVVGQTSTETTVTTETTETTETEQTDVEKKDKSTTKKKKRNAAALVAELTKANLYLFKVSKKSTQLNAKKKVQRPYWLGLKTISTKSEGMKKALTKKDKSFFKLLSETGVAVTDVRNGVSLIGVKDKEIHRGVKAVTLAYNELYKNYGKEAVRKKKGGDLTKKESEQLTKMETEAKTVETKLTSMRKKVAAQKKKNPRLLKQLDRAITTSKKLSRKKDKSVAAYTEKLKLSNSLRNNWKSFGDYSKVWYPEIYSEWNTTNTSINTYIENYEVNVTNIEVNNWSYVENEVEVVDVDNYGPFVDDTEITQDEKLVEEYSEKEATEENTKEETEATENTETTTEDSESKTEETEATTNEKSDETSDESETSEEKSDDTSEDLDTASDDKDEDSSTNDESANDDNSSKDDESSSNDDDSSKDESSNDDDPGTNDNSSSNDDSSNSNDDSSNSNDDSSSNNDDDSSNEPPPEA